ncbi:hypothetical protein KQI65_17130 [bacterium]|nr:hypothetical protein [bacterium]
MATRKHIGSEQNCGGETYPQFCDFSCPHADFSDPSAVGACRRDIGVWCRKAGRLHNKNTRCLFHRGDRESAGTP